jgi:cytochrome c peroxidase
MTVTRHIVCCAAFLAGFVSGGVPADAVTAGMRAAHAPAMTDGDTKLSVVATLGAQIFHDRSLSATGQLSCASCHDPLRAYASGTALPVQPGGPHLRLQGFRATPSLGYLTMTPPFSVGPESPTESEPKRVSLSPSSQPAPQPRPLARQPLTAPKATSASAAIVPQGGFFRDGRADTLEDQFSGPLLSPFEMDNASVTAVRDKLMRAPYAGEFTKLFGAPIFADELRTLSEAAFAVARYEIEDRSFHPFTSKYDGYLRGTAKLSAAEQRGLQLFDGPDKGNCASCHPDKIAPDGGYPVFTDYQFEALGVPRNRAIRVNRDPHFFDLGICGPLRGDAYAKQSANCALFKTPSLRNVALRHAFFHNGVFHTLGDVLHFYVERDTDPGKWYPRNADGQIDKFDDMPARYRANVDTIDAPLNRHPGQKPALDDAQIADIIAFLNTLTDGYSPAPVRHPVIARPSSRIVGLF